MSSVDCFFFSFFIGDGSGISNDAGDSGQLLSAPASCSGVSEIWLSETLEVVGRGVSV